MSARSGRRPGGALGDEARSALVVASRSCASTPTTRPSRPYQAVKPPAPASTQHLVPAVAPRGLLQRAQADRRPEAGHRVPARVLPGDRRGRPPRPARGPRPSAPRAAAAPRPGCAARAMSPAQRTPRPSCACARRWAPRRPPPGSRRPPPARSAAARRCQAPRGRTAPRGRRPARPPWPRRRPRSPSPPRPSAPRSRPPPARPQPRAHLGAQALRLGRVLGRHDRHGQPRASPATRRPRTRRTPSRSPPTRSAGPHRGGEPRRVLDRPDRVDAAGSSAPGSGGRTGSEPVQSTHSP